MTRTTLPILVLAGCVACNEAQLQEPPEAGLDACAAHTVVFCDAAAADAAVCVGEPGDAAAPAADASYAVGCTANVIGTLRDPNTGVCALTATCTCQGVDASVAWVCAP